MSERESETQPGPDVDVDSDVDLDTVTDVGVDEEAGAGVGIEGEAEHDADGTAGTGEGSAHTWGPRPNPLLCFAPVAGWASEVGVAFDGLLAAVGAPFEPLRTRWRSNPLLHRTLPIVAGVALIGWYLVVFTHLVWIRHDRFGSFDYDLGMYDHGIWQTAHGRNFMTTRGMNLFGHHANVGFLLFVPFYWIGIGGPHFLNVVNNLGIIATALPLWWLARDHLRSHWAGFWLSAVYLFHFSTQWKIQETFHAESLAAPFVVAAFWAASRGRWRWWWWCIVGALIWKEDVALATAALGLAVGFVFGRWRTAAATVAFSAVWFLVATRILMPAFSPEGAVFDSLFGPLGSDATEVVTNSLRHPSRLMTTLDCHGFWDGRLEVLTEPVEGVACPGPEALEETNPPPRGLAALMGPLGYLGFLSPALLLVGLPQHVVNYATIMNFTWDLRWHYAHLPFIGVVLATTWATVRRRRAAVAWAMIAVMVVGVVVTHERGVGTWTEAGRAGWWPLTEDPVYDVYRRAMRSIDDDDVVSANYFFVPHLSHRERIYTFPNPWVPSNWGPGGVGLAPPDPGVVDVLLVDAARLGETDRQLFDGILASGEFEVTLHESVVPGSDRPVDLYRLERR